MLAVGRHKAQSMIAMHVKIGDSVKFPKTVGESDIYLFAGADR